MERRLCEFCLKEVGEKKKTKKENWTCRLGPSSTFEMDFYLMFLL